MNLGDTPVRFRRHAPMVLSVLVGGGLALAADPSRQVLQPEHLVRNWETEAGLPENSVTSIAQTRDGYLWVGTFSGLARFDGTSFATFDPANTPQLPSAGIINLHCDAADRLWVSTLRGLAVRENGRWQTLTSSQVSETNFIRTFSHWNDVLCLTTFDGRVFRADGTRLTELPAPPGQPGSGYLGHVDRSGRIWAGQDGFFGHWDGQRWNHSALESAVTNTFRGFGSGRDGTMWVLLQDRLLRLEGDRETARFPLPLLPGRLWQVYEDRRSTVWLCTQESGLVAVRPDGLVRHYSRTNGLAADMVTDSIRGACEDSEGNLWLATTGAGLVALTERRFVELDLPSLAPVKRVTALLEDGPGRMLLGSYGRGVAIRDERGVRPLLAGDGSPLPSFIQSLCRDAEGGLWLGTYKDGLRVLQPDGQVRRLDDGEAGTFETAALLRDSRGRIWIGGRDSIAVQERGGLRSFRATPLPLGRVSSFAENPVTGEIWAASAEGVFHGDGQLWSELRDAEGRSLKESVCVHCDATGTVWIGGSTVPVRRFKNGRVSAIGAANGLPVAKVGALIDDLAGHWWLTSNRGVVKVTKADLDAVADGVLPRLAAQVFTESDGLPSLECVSGFQSPALRDQAGRLWFATLKGVAMVDPRNLRLNTNPPPIHFTQFRIEDHAGRQTNLPVDFVQTVVVPPGQKEVSVGFGAVCFTAPEKVRLAYRIEGLHDSWNDLGGRRTIYFFPPPPGTYRLHVRAANNDGVWNEAGATLAFAIQPYYWQTLWFRGLLVAGSLGGTVLVVWRLSRFRLRQRVRQLEQQALIERERSRLGGVLEATTDLVAFADREGRIQFLNAAGRRLLGLGSGDDGTGRMLATLHPPDAGRQLLETALPAATRDGSWQGESSLARADGRIVPASLVLLVQRNPQGEVEWMATMARDIRDRKQAEVALRRSEEKFSQMFRRSPVPLGLSRLATGEVIEINDAMEALTGLRRDEVVGLSTVSLGLWTDEAERRRQVMNLQMGSTPRPRELRLRRRGGEERTVHYVAERIDLGGEACVLTAMSDLTERLQMEQALKASATLLRQFVQFTPAAVAMFDRALTYLEVSDRWRLDYRLGNRELLGRSHYEIFPDIPERWREIHRRALAGSVERCDEDRFDRADGTVEWLQWEIRPWRQPDGEIGGIIMFTQVITERKQTLLQVQAQLAELQRWHRLTLDREGRVLQLKAEVNALSRRLGERPPYGETPEQPAAPATPSA